jgi:hypothetical protein
MLAVIEWCATRVVRLIWGRIAVDDLAAAAKMTACEVLSNLGHRFHRISRAS